MRRVIFGLTAALVLAASSIFGFVLPARANGVPVPVDLSYIDLSNWGPQDATGYAELIFAEGVATLEADGLPMLEDQMYQAWLVNSEAGDAISIGRFNARASGRVAFEGTLPPIADFGFDLLIFTVEDEPDTAPQPSERRSIGGYFSLIGTTPADSVAEGGGSGLESPGQLPNTGDPGLLLDLVRFSALAAAMGLSVVMGLSLGRRTA